MLHSQRFLSVPRRSGRALGPSPVSGTFSHWKECPGACADTNSCWSCVPTSRTTRPRRSSTAPLARIVAAGGQIVKVAPWGRRRLAYPIDRYREGSYHIILFEAPADAIAETRAQPPDHRGGPPPPRHPRRAAGAAVPPRRLRRRAATRSTTPICRSAEDEEDEDDTERIDESETEAAPAAID